MSYANQNLLSDESSDLHKHMAEWFGLPDTHEKDHEEIFGWYHVDDTRYWSHDPSTGAFHVITTDNQWRRPNLSGDWEKGDLEEIAKLMDSLQFLPPPSLPDDPTSAARSESFAYEGWLFAWFFVPDLRRWELGILERRWHVEPKAERASEDLSSAREAGRDRLLYIATKAVDAGAQLIDRYCKAMLLLGSWNPPEPEDGFRLIVGAVVEAESRFTDPTEIGQLVSKATGCSESVVQSVISYLDATGLHEAKWFRGAESAVLIPGFNDLY